MEAGMTKNASKPAIASGLLAGLITGIITFWSHLPVYSPPPVPTINEKSPVYFTSKAIYASEFAKRDAYNADHRSRLTDALIIGLIVGTLSATLIGTIVFLPLRYGFLRNWPAIANSFIYKNRLFIRFVALVVGIGIAFGFTIYAYFDYGHRNSRAVKLGIGGGFISSLLTAAVLWGISSFNRPHARNE